MSIENVKVRNYFTRQCKMSQQILLIRIEKEKRNFFKD